MHIINLGILAHVDAGKTTLTESLLYHGGAIRSMGKVDKGTTTADSMELEQKRGMTIRSSTVSFLWNETKINIIDTPGHMDFAAEVERSLSVIDGVILVISAKEGVQPQTRVMVKKLREMKLPFLIFLNKLDRMGVCVENVYEEIRKQLSLQILPMQRVEGAGEREFFLRNLDVREDALREEIIGGSEELLDRYINGASITAEMLEEALRAQILSGDMVPVYHGSALGDKGVTDVLNAVTRFFSGISSYGSELEELCACIYKLERDRRNHRCFYFRIFTGSIAYKEQVVNAETGRAFTISSLCSVKEGKTAPAARISAGDIGVIMDVPGLRCGDYLGSRSAARTGCRLERPLLTAAAEYRNPEERRDLLTALKELEEEDPMLAVKIDPLTEEIKIRFYGLLQMEILESVLWDRFGIRAQFGLPSAVRVEQPLSEAEAEIRIGDRNNLLYAGIRLKIAPLASGEGFRYENRVSYGYLERPFQNAVLEGIRTGLAEGLGGHEVVDVLIVFLEADYDSVMGTPADFRKLAPAVVRLALEKASVRILAPWQSFELSAPAGLENGLLSDLARRRAQTADVVFEGEEVKISGIIPLERAGDLPVALAGRTEGRAVFESRFYRYLPEDEMKENTR